MKSNEMSFKVNKPGKGKKFPHHTQRCVACNLPFNGRKEAVCNFCGTCQRCETITPDKHGNYCIHCQNFIEQARYDELGITVVIHHNPVHPLDELPSHEPRRHR